MNEEEWKTMKIPPCPQCGKEGNWTIPAYVYPLIAYKEKGDKLCEELEPTDEILPTRAHICKGCGYIFLVFAPQSFPVDREGIQT